MSLNPRPSVLIGGGSETDTHAGEATCQQRYRPEGRRGLLATVGNRKRRRGSSSRGTVALLPLHLGLPASGMGANRLLLFQGRRSALLCSGDPRAPAWRACPGLGRGLLAHRSPVAQAGSLAWGPPNVNQEDTSPTRTRPRSSLGSCMQTPQPARSHTLVPVCPRSPAHGPCVLI